MKRDICEFYIEVRSATEKLCEELEVEDYVIQPAFFGSPVKWHVAHTTWFFEEFVLSKEKLNYKRFHPEYAFLFNSYYNTIGDRMLRANRGDLSRPTVKEVFAYREYVDEQMVDYLESQKPSEDILSVLELGLNHEQQHQELLLTDLKYALSLNPLYPVYKKDGAMVHQKEADNSWIEIDSGLYQVGFEGDGFCYDNELKRHKVYLDKFSISKNLVSNKDFIEFINEDGYYRHELWLDEGWAWIKEQQISSPLYWIKEEDSYSVFTLGGKEKLDLDSALCHVSYYEAEAFARWKSCRLPTEKEWEVACDSFKWGSRWEWTSSAYSPYPGFKVAEGAIGEYNGKFMVNQMVLRGASVATAKGHSRKTYRNFFHPHFQWQFAGIRLVK